MASCTAIARAWKTVVTVCAAVPPTSPACVTWAGHLTCPHPHLPLGPLPHVAPETVAATSTATAASGVLVSAMSARTGHGGSTVKGAGLAAMAMPRALVAADPVSATGMGTHAMAIVTTSAGCASARTTLRVPTASSAPQATTGIPGPVAPVSGSVGVVPSSPTCPQWLWGPAALEVCCLQVAGQQEPGLACPIVFGLFQPLRSYSLVLLGPSVPHSPLPSPLTAVPPAR